MIDKGNVWKDPNIVNLTLSRDYLGADKQEFQNTYLLIGLFCTVDKVSYGLAGGINTRKDVCHNPTASVDYIRKYINRQRRSAENVTIRYHDVNLKAGSDGVVRIGARSGGCRWSPKHGRQSTPCGSDYLWTKKTVIGDEAYFTLEAYNVKPAKLQQMHCF